MSSHHFVKENQEPFLFVKGNNFPFEIVEQFMPYDNLNPVHKFAKLINEEKNKKRRQKKHTNIMEHNNIKRMYTEDDMAKKLYEFGKLVLDTFHSEGRTHSGEDRLARIKFDEWFNQLNGIVLWF